MAALTLSNIEWLRGAGTEGAVVAGRLAEGSVRFTRSFCHVGWIEEKTLEGKIDLTPAVGCTM